MKRLLIVFSAFVLLAQVGLGQIERGDRLGEGERIFSKELIERSKQACVLIEVEDKRGKGHGSGVRFNGEQRAEGVRPLDARFWLELNQEWGQGRRAWRESCESSMRERFTT